MLPYKKKYNQSFFYFVQICIHTHKIMNNTCFTQTNKGPKNPCMMWKIEKSNIKTEISEAVKY